MELNSSVTFNSIFKLSIRAKEYDRPSKYYFWLVFAVKNNSSICAVAVTCRGKSS